jgi:hypothetical protein
MSTPRSIAEELVLAWVENDYDGNRRGPTPEAAEALVQRITRALAVDSEAGNDEDAEAARRKASGRCTVSGCKRPPAWGDDLCRKHYANMKRFGVLEVGEVSGREEADSERRKLQRLGVIGNPLAISPDAENDPERKTACPAYNRCLEFMLKTAPKTHRRGVPGSPQAQNEMQWTCVACDGPGLQRGNHRIGGGVEA